MNRKSNGAGLRAEDKIMRRRRSMEAMATFGLIVICVGLVAPITSPGGGALFFTAMRWVYTLGAVMFTVARGVNVNLPGDSIRVRRYRRMELWAGIAFLVGAALWFYNASRIGGFFFSLAVMRDTIAFTMAGAIIQMVSSWLVARQIKKES